MQKHFDVVIVSTWGDDKGRINVGNVVTIFNPKPQLAGYSHRNYQRYSTARGIELAKELECDYVLKWRTDMLPTKIDVSQLIEWANFDIPNGMSSRIVTCAFRNLTVHDDWYSSIPDLFAFGHVKSMELLWGDEGFDYTKIMNPPAQMLTDIGDDWMHRADVSGYWCAESELYAIFKDRLQKKLGIKLSHEEIAKNYMRLFDHEKFSIIWFGEKGKLRPIFQAVQHPWWNESNWMGVKQIKYSTKGYETNNYFSFFIDKYNMFLKFKELYFQYKYYKGYIGEEN